MTNENIQQFVLQQRNVIDWIADIVEKEHKGDRGLIEALLASAFSAGLQKRSKLVHVFVSGPAQSGKSHSQRTVAKLFSQVDSLTHMSDKILLYRKYKDRSILFIDDESVGWVGMEVMKAFTSPDDSVPRVERVMDGVPYVRDFPHVVAIWRNAVRLPSDEQIISRFLVFRTQPSDSITTWAMQDARISDEELKNAKEVIDFLLAEPADVIIRYPPQIRGHVEPRQARFIMNLLASITYANRYSNPTFDKDAKTVEPLREDYETLIRLIERARLLAAPFMDDVDEAIYKYVKDNGSAESPRRLKEIANAIGETEQVCRRRLDRMSDFISFGRGTHNTYEYYVSKPLPDAGYVGLPAEVGGDGNGSESQ
jgi:hypothetical protein